MLWPATTADGPGDPLAPVRRLQVQQEGRVLTLEQAARQVLARAGMPRTPDPLRLALLMMAEPSAWKDQPLLLVRPPRLCRLFDPSADGPVRVSPSALRRHPGFHRLHHAVADRVRWGQRLDRRDRDVLELEAAADGLERLVDQRLRLLRPRSDGRAAWMMILDPPAYAAEQQIGVKRAWSSLLRAVRQGDAAGVREAAERVARIVGNLDAQAAPSADRRLPSAVGVAAGLAALGWLLAAGRGAWRRRATERPVPAQVPATSPADPAAWCPEHGRGPEAGSSQECQVARFWPELRDVAAHARPEADEFPPALEARICRDRCGGLRGREWCERRMRGECCLWQFMPMVERTLAEERSSARDHAPPAL
jgi:hypothetical protein